MLVVPSFVEKSPISGFGVFAVKKIKKGDVVWLFDPNADQTFTASEFEDLLVGLSKENRDRFEHWSYKRGNTYILCADNSKFLNHSSDPNCGGEIMTIDFALKDIKAGEELTCNYLNFDEVSQKEGLSYG
jgi:SET domain-containing protein